MKKLFFTLIAFMTICTTAMAVGPFKFGVVAGMNITKGEVTSENAKVNGWAPDSESGWFAGLQLKATVPVFGIGVDASLIYNRESISIPVASGSDITSKKENMDYLAIPVHLRYDLQLPAISQIVVPYVFTGPQAGIAISKIDKAYLEAIDTNDVVWRFDLGLGVILLSHLQAAYSYSFPLSNTYEGKVNQLIDDYEQGVHRISLTYFF